LEERARTLVPAFLGRQDGIYEERAGLLLPAIRMRGAKTRRAVAEVSTSSVIPGSLAAATSDGEVNWEGDSEITLSGVVGNGIPLKKCRIFDEVAVLLMGDSDEEEAY